MILGQTEQHRGLQETFRGRVGLRLATFSVGHPESFAVLRTKAGSREKQRGMHGHSHLEILVVNGLPIISVKQK